MTQAPTRTLPFVDLSHVNAAVQRDVLADVAADRRKRRVHERPARRALRARLRRLLRRARVRRHRERARCAAARADRGRRWARRRGDRPRPDLHRHLRGGQPGRGDAGRGRRERGRLQPGSRRRGRGGSGRAPAASCRCTCSGRWPTCAGWPTSPGARGLQHRGGRLPGPRRDPGRPSPRRGRPPRPPSASIRPRTWARFGDAGALVTDDPALAATARSLRQHGERERHVSERIGYTARLDTLQAAVLLRKLPLLDGWNGQRREAAAAVHGRARGRRRHPPACRCRRAAGRCGTSTRCGPPTPMRSRVPGRARHRDGPPLPAAAAPLGRIRRARAPPGAFPVAESLAAELVSLPIFPGISDRQVEWVADSMQGYFDRGL